MANNPFMDLPDAPKQQTSSNPFMELDDVKETGRNREQYFEGSALREIGEGVVSGALGAVEGVVGLGALAVDLVADTDYSDKVHNAAESARDVLGLDPEGLLGKGAEIITQFVVPGGIAAKGAKALTVAGRAARAAKVAQNPVAKGFGNKAKRLVTDPKTVLKDYATDPKRWETAAFAGADFAVASGNEATLGDWVDAGPTQTSELIGLRGREKALARLGNRAKVAAEGGVLGEVAQGVLGAAGKTIGDAKVTKDIAQAANRKIDQTTKNIDNLLEQRLFAKSNNAEELSTAKGYLADAIAFSRYRGYLPGQVADKRLLMDGQVDINIKKADRILNSLDKEIDSVLKKLPENESSLNKVSIMGKVERYLTESDAVKQKRVLGELPKGVRQNAMRMRGHINRLSRDVLNSNYLKEQKYTKDGLNVNDMVEKNINTYLRRRYKIFEDSKYVPTDKSVKDADRFFTSSRTSTAKELTEAARKDVNNVFTKDFLSKNGLTKVGAGNDFKIEVGNKVTPEAARVARKNFLDRYSIKNRDLSSSGRVASDRLETGMFETRKKIPTELRALMGEVNDPREAYLGTVADLAQFSAVDDYFATTAKLARENSGIGKFFKDGRTLSDDQKLGLIESGFVKLGGKDGKTTGFSKKDAQGQTIEDDGIKSILEENSSGWGELDGFYVPKGVYNNLSNHVFAEDSLGANAANAIVGSFLKAKGLSQYAKTVLSPITQVRNFTTATLFATANGNMPILGRGGSLTDSFKTVHANVTNKGPESLFNDLADAQRRGVIGTNAELREIQDSLNKGLDLYGQEPKNFAEATIGSTKLGAKVLESKTGKAVGGSMKLMEDIYQGSDDFWKYFSYNAEQSQIRHMLKDATPEQQVAYLTKNGTDSGAQGSVGNILARNDKIKRGEIDQDMIDDLIKDRAGQIVRDTVPNYNKGASDLIKFGRKMPVGNFITFPAEMMRTGFNIVKQGLDDMASDIDGVRIRGIKRLSGFAATTIVAPFAAAQVGYAVSGVSKEEMDAYQRSFAAPWEKGAVLIPTGRTEDGKITYINYSTSNPYDVLSRFATRAMNEADTAIKENKDPGDALGTIATETVKELFQPFLSEAMLTEAIVDISLRGGKTVTGAEVYNQEDAFGTKVAKRIMHVVDTAIPGFVPANISGGVPEPSRFLRGTLGTEEGFISYKDKMGRERTFVGEMVRAMSGVTPLEFDPKKGLEYGGFRMQRSQTDAKKMFNRVVDDENGDARTLYNGFVAANEAKFRVDKEYYQMVEDLRTMGMKDSEIRRVFKREGIGGVKGIMRGEFEPFKMSDKNRKDMQKAGIYEFYPRERINQLRQDMRRLPLAPDDDPSKVKPMSAPSTSTPAVNPFMSLPDAQTSVTPAARPNLGPSTTAVNPFMTLPSLAGGDPNTQEIARRLNLG